MGFYEKTVESWIKNNEKFFGVPAISYFAEYDEITSKAKEYCDKYWNSKNPDDWCTLRAGLQDKIQSKNIRFDLEYNFNCYTVTVETEFVSKKNLAVIPIVYDNINWEIKGSLYCPRAIAVRNNKFMNKIDNKVFYPFHWIYDIENDDIRTFSDDIEFSSDDIDEKSELYLKTFTNFEKGEDRETFKTHLRELPNTNYNNVINYIYTDYKYFFDKIMEKVAFYNFNSKTMINCSFIIVSNGRIKKDSNDIGALLVLNNENNNHFAINNLRSIMLLTTGYSNSFFFEKCAPYFDAFKVSTNKNAGKLRLILDDVEIKNGMMYKTVNGEELNQFEVYKRYYINGDESMITDTLSDMSKSPYCFNNGPKRIMMTGKAYGQSISVVDEYNHETHAIKARIVFSDFFGYTIGDGLVISESFADRMLHRNKEILTVTKKFKHLIEKYYDFKNDKPIGFITLDDYIDLRQKSTNKFRRYENIQINRVQLIGSNYQVSITYEISTQVGDKLTNLHGAKGVIGLILPDDMMPRLVKDYGDMKAGPFDIITSSSSIRDRGNIGQIYEANSNCNTNESCKNMVEYEGNIYNKAFGVIDILRLFHTNIYHASMSNIENSFNEMINLGEMERNCLLIQNLPKLLREIDCRSNRNFSEKIADVVYNNCENNDADKDRGMFLNVLNSLGYELNIRNDDGYVLEINKHILNTNVDNEISEKNSIIYNKNGKISGTGIYDSNLSRIEKMFVCPKCGRKEKDPFLCDCGEEGKKSSSYIKLFCPVTNAYIDYNNVENRSDRKIIQNLLEYNGYLINGEYFDYVPGTPLIKENVVFGLNAIKELFGDKYDDFINENFNDYIFLVDYKYRKPILSGKSTKVVSGDLNMLYIKLINDENQLSELYNTYDNPYIKFCICSKFNQRYKNFIDNFINILYVGKNSIIKKNVVSQKISAAIRGVIIPAPYIPEDCAAFSTIFADTLFPQLKGLWSNAKELNEIISWGHFSLPSYLFDYENNLGKKHLYPWDDGFSWDDLCKYHNLTINEIKKTIKDNSDPNKPYYGLINRPPSICHLSFQGLKPIFFDDIGRGHYARNFKNPNKILDEYPTYNPMSACIGINPMICQGMNADFDSDVLFYMSIFSDEDLSSMLASKNFKTISNGEIRNGLEDMHKEMLEYFYKYDNKKAKIIHDMIEKLEKK